MKTIKRYTEQEQLHYLELWKESGLSQRAFCEQQGIVQKIFNNWKRARMPKVNPTRTADTGFVKMDPASAEKQQPAAITISIGRYSVSVDNSFNPTLLSAVLSVLEGRNVH
jgi:hypothetical protein